jgi:hypothetical protein
MKVNKQRRWPLAIGIIATVIILSSMMVYTNRLNSANRISLQAVSDGRGGIIALWQKGRQMHSQRIDTSGKAAWGVKGTLISDRFTPSTLSWQLQTSLIPDINGGAVATWDDRSSLSNDPNDPANFSSLPVYSQRLNADGAPLWGDGISTGTTQKIGNTLTQPISTGDGGIVFVYDDFKVAYKALHDDYFYLQKVSPEGLPLWGEKGVLLYSSPPFRPVTIEDQARGEKGTWTRDEEISLKFSVMSDQAGGAMLVRREEKPGQDIMTIYAQRYDAGGKPVWGENGIQVSSAPNMDFQAVSDGSGGILVVNDSNNQMVIQRISADGDLLWSPSGVVIPPSGYYSYNSQIIVYSPGSPIIFWGKLMVGGLIGQDNAVRLNAEGNIIWQRTSFITPGPHQQDHQLSFFSDRNFLYLAWCLSEYDFYQTGASQIIVQKMDGEGNLMWGEKGIVALPDGKLKYQSAPRIVSDGAGGAIVLGIVGRSILQGDTICAQRLDSSGKLLWGQGIKIYR